MSESMAAVAILERNIAVGGIGRYIFLWVEWISASGIRYLWVDWFFFLGCFSGGVWGLLLWVVWKNC